MSRPNPRDNQAQTSAPDLRVGVDSRELKLALLERFRNPAYKPPVLPTVAVELLALSQKKRATAAQFADLLGQDPMLAAQVLRMAESAIHGGGEPVRSLDEAIVRLGLARLTDLFFQASLEMRIFRAPGYEADMERLRAHSVATAEIARLVSRHALGFDEYAFLCGLLHDVGIAGCILALAELSKTARVSFNESSSAVRDVHESCSEFLASAWRLPAEMGLVLGSHHHFARDGMVHPMSAIVGLADALAEENGFGFHAESDALQAESAARVLGLSADALSVLRSDVAALAERLHRPGSPTH